MLYFHIENEYKINPLCFMSGISPEVAWSDSIPILAPLREHYLYRIKNHLYDNHFVGHVYHFPISEITLREIIFNFVCFFPVYDSYIQMAKGLPVRLDTLILKLSEWLQRDIPETETESNFKPPEALRAHAIQAAESRVRVLPTLRWQVFQRDQWKCVACGKTSHDGAILHVDHIVPRSRGGLDTPENLQTLCDQCNIGKGNRDATNLRKRV